MATLLDRLNSSPNPERDAFMVATIFGPVITRPDSPVPDNRWWGEYLEEALKILHLAADLDLMFRRSLSDWSISPSQKELKKMNLEPRNLVEYGLDRRGDQDCENYDTLVSVVPSYIYITYDIDV
jgi:hypothetical protein